jgi:hypothetical protein
MLGFVLFHPNKATRVNHFRRLQSDSAEFTYNLAKRIIRETCHRRLQQRRID